MSEMRSAIAANNLNALHTHTIIGNQLDSIIASHIGKRWPAILEARAGRNV